MADFCSLCKEEKKVKLLDGDDPLFSMYTRIMHFFGASKKQGSPGICDFCMPNYLEMEKKYQEKKTFYLALAIVFGAIYFYLTSNVLISLIIALFALSLSLFSYVPPLKR